MMIIKDNQSGKIEQELRDSEERLRILFEYAPDAIYLSDFKGVFIDGNQAAEKLIGYKKEDLIGKSFLRLNLLTPTEILRAAATLAKNALGQPTGPDEFTLIRKDKSKSVVEIRTFPVKIKGQTLVLGIARDITQRKKAEEVLLESEEKYRSLFTSSRDAIMIIKPPSWNFISGNQATIEMFRVKDEDEFSSFGPWNLSPERQPDGRASAEKAKEMIQTAMREGSHFFEWTHKRLDGEEFPTTVLLSRISQAGKMFLQATVRDITEQKKTEDKLEHAAQEWRTTFDSISAMISLHDKDYKIRRVNKAFAAAFNMYPKDVVGKTCYELVHGTKEPPSSCPHKQALDTQKPEKAEFFEPRLSVWLSVAVSPVFDQEGKVTSCVHIVEDITTHKESEEKLSLALKEEMESRKIMTSMLDDNNRIRKELEGKLKELKQAQVMLVQSEKLASLGKLVADMAHEVNNPLMIISGNAQLSLLEDGLSQELKKNLHIIHEECNRAKNIIQRLLMFSRPNKGELKSLDINQSIESVLKLLEHQFGLSNVKINTRFTQGLAPVLMDEKQFQEVIMNFLNNARDAMPNGGSIDISTYLDGEDLKIEVKDLGCGMADETLNRLFEPFFTTKEKGTGLGLAVCYGIIKAHNGKIEFKSQLGEGTAVYVSLPIKVE